MSRGITYIEEISIFVSMNTRTTHISLRISLTRDVTSSSDGFGSLVISLRINCIA